MQTDDSIIASAQRILMRRLQRVSQIVSLSSTKEIKEYLTLSMGELENEEFGCLFLDYQRRVTGYECLFKGIVNHCTVYVRTVVGRALANNSSGVILVHNHPSLSGLPSQADIQLTEELQKALNFVDVAVHDHVIVFGNGAYSMKENGHF